jgi:hypothetical protein
MLTCAASAKWQGRANGPYALGEAGLLKAADFKLESEAPLQLLSAHRIVRKPVSSPAFAGPCFSVRCAKQPFLASPTNGCLASFVEQVF